MRSLLTPKVPPHSEEAEQSVLGALMESSKCHPEVMALVREADFYFERHRIIFAAITGLSNANRPCDFICVSDWLRQRGQLEQVDGIAYVGNLVNNNPGSANGMEYARIVREKSAIRAIASAGDAMTEMALRPEGRTLVEMLTLAEIAIEAIRNQSASANTAKSFADHLPDMQRHYADARAARSAGGILGVPTGIESLDKVIGGLQKQRFYGIAARPGTGKSALLNQIALHAAMNGRKGLVITAEMTGLELMQRALASRSGVNLFHIINGSEREAERVIQSGAQLGDIPLWLDGDTNTLAGAIAQMALHKARYGIEWAAVDHIGLMETPKFASRNDQIGFITRSLKKAAKQLNIAVVGLMQLNRGSETDNRQPRLHDLRDSGNIEQDLDVAIFLHTPHEKRTDKLKPLQIGVLKNRSGMSTWLPDEFVFNGGLQTISVCDGFGHTESSNESEWRQMA